MAHFEPHEDTLKIKSFLENCEPGKTFSYPAISIGSGVQMDEKGKQKLRSACRMLGIEYICTPGYGITIPDETIAVEPVARRLIKIDNAVKRGERTTNNIKDKFLKKMSDEDRKQIVFTGAIFGAIRAAASESKMLYYKKPREIQDKSPLIPTKTN